MFMDQLGYILSEGPVLALMIWFAVRYVQLRRYRENRPPFSEQDRFILFRAGQKPSRTWQFYSRFALAVVAVMVLGLGIIAVFAPFGAAIVTGVLVLTAADVVRRLLLLRT